MQVLNTRRPQDGCEICLRYHPGLVRSTFQRVLEAEGPSATLGHVFRERHYSWTTGVDQKTRTYGHLIQKVEWENYTLFSLYSTELNCSTIIYRRLPRSRIFFFSCLLCLVDLHVRSVNQPLSLMLICHLQCIRRPGESVSVRVGLASPSPSPLF